MTFTVIFILSAFLICHFPQSHPFLKVFTFFPPLSIASFHPFLFLPFFLLLPSFFPTHSFTSTFIILLIPFFALGLLYLLLPFRVYSFPLLLSLFFAVTFLTPLPYQTYSFFSSFCIGHFSILKSPDSLI